MLSATVIVCTRIYAALRNVCASICAAMVNVCVWRLSGTLNVCAPPFSPAAVLRNDCVPVVCVIRTVRCVSGVWSATLTTIGGDGHGCGRRCRVDATAVWANRRADVCRAANATENGKPMTMTTTTTNVRSESADEPHDDRFVGRRPKDWSNVCASMGSDVDDVAAVVNVSRVVERI